MTTLITCKWDCYEKTNRITDFLFPASINIMKDTTKEIDKSRSGNEPPARACELFCILVQNPIHFVDIRLGRANSFLMKLTINWQSDMTHKKISIYLLIFFELFNVLRLCPHLDHYCHCGDVDDAVKHWFSRSQTREITVVKTSLLQTCSFTIFICLTQHNLACSRFDTLSSASVSSADTTFSLFSRILSVTRLRVCFS